MVDCPVDSCEYSAETENSVIAHASSSKGEHTGIGFQKAKQMIALGSEGGGEDGSQEDTDASDSVDTGPVDFPDATDDGGRDVAENTDMSGECKRCGSSTITYDADEDVFLNGSFVATVEAGDEFCAECGRVVEDSGEVVNLW